MLEVKGERLEGRGERLKVRGEREKGKRIMENGKWMLTYEKNVVLLYIIYMEEARCYVSVRYDM